MGTKHTPANGLPWITVNNNYGRTVLVSKPVFEAAGEKANIWTGRIFNVPQDRRRRQDALYAQHAANAYPQLVEALKDARARLTVSGVQYDALLRRLGEAE